MDSINLLRFKTSAEFNKIRFSRCVYLIRPVADKRFGIEPTWIKVGISRTRLGCRLRAYQTYWPSGLDVLAVATVVQGPESPVEAISAVEKAILRQVRRFGNSESCHADQAETVMNILRNDPRVYSIYTPRQGLRKNQAANA